MKVLVKGVHLKVDEPLREFVQAHLVDPVNQFYDNAAAEIEIHLSDNNGPKGGIDKTCSVTVRMPGMASVHVEEATEDIYKSVALVGDRLEETTKRTVQKRREYTETSDLA